MKLWTIQPIQIWDLLQQQGYYHGDKKYIKEEFFLRSYDWIKQQLAKKTGVMKDYYPVWVWAKKPDLRTGGHLPKGTKGVRLELEIDENKVLFSDFKLWHFVLNYWYIPNTMEEGDKFDLELEKIGLMPNRKISFPEFLHNKIENSWQKIFDLNWHAEGIADKKADKIIQGVVWEIRLEEIVSVKEFIAKM